MKVTNLARFLAPNCVQETVGIRPGEKFYEQMIVTKNHYYRFKYPEQFKILPSINDWGISPERIKDGKKFPEGFIYSSDNNIEWMSDLALQCWIDNHREKIGSI
jgi:FlaA1/EpsC-like NDP-sugar epimerase